MSASHVLSPLVGFPHMAQLNQLSPGASWLRGTVVMAFVKPRPLGNVGDSSDDVNGLLGIAAEKGAHHG
ncbi:hypothetical protein STRTUCAR8_08746 [Streptomyces turgidiscabies Car8]|uniref:Uncharacterized protein n=1 Tax=Streptomyces turgidiscabies (strain Car8) TaxID=698760 RepID=L7F0B3_STRT8|nr:hypothetical protein STRTUCAR8_08746 [Streptomyces turgidiscabies Car8]